MHNRKLQLFIGNEATCSLTKQAFVQQWEALYESCPWATVFENPQYVNTWYACYQHKYLPIVVAETKGDRLTGLLTMALLKSTNSSKIFIVHAGHGEADCQAWLAEEATGDRFITSALDLILKEFPKEDILLRHIPPGTPMGWATTTRYWAQKCIIETFDRPLIKMQDFSLSKRERKRINQLNAIATFEVISDTPTLMHHLDEIGVLYDFRHGAMFNRTPFTEDTSYKSMLLSLFEKGGIEVTVLKVKGEVIASIAATVGKNKAHLGSIICHSPVYATYSPGIVLFLLTSQYFDKKGYDYFDLTPGGDTYKVRLATGHDKVKTMVITNNRAFYIWRRFRNYIQSVLVKRGINPLNLKLLVQRKKYLYKEKGLSKLLTNQKKDPFQNKTLCQINPIDFSQAAGFPPVRKNDLADLLKYTSTESEHTKWEFLETAMRLLEAGLQVYTWADTDKLMCCVWLKPAGLKPPKEHAAHLPSDATVLNDIYCHPLASCHLDRFIGAVLQHNFTKPQMQGTYIILDNPGTLGTLCLRQVNNHRTVSSETVTVPL